jgi:hypothetical protein
MMMDMGMMGGGTDYAPLYAQAKEILAAGMLAELKDDAKEAMGQGDDNGGDSCPHCGAPMGGGMGMTMPKMGLGAPEMPPAAPPMPDLSQFAMRMPPPAGPAMPPIGGPMRPPMRPPMPGGPRPPMPGGM